MDEDLIETAVDALEGLIGQLIEETHDQAIDQAPADPAGRLQRLQELQRVGTDLAILADAAGILVRRSQTAQSVRARTSQ